MRASLCSGPRSWSGPTPKALLSSYCIRWASLNGHLATADASGPAPKSDGIMMDPAPNTASALGLETDPAYEYVLEDADDDEGPCTATVRTASALALMMGRSMAVMDAVSGRYLASRASLSASPICHR